MRMIVATTVAAVAVSLALVAQGAARPGHGIDAPLASAGSPSVRLAQYGGRGGDRLNECQTRAHRRGLDGREFQSYVRQCMDRGSYDFDDRRGRYGGREQKSERQNECEARGQRRGLDGREFQSYVRRCMDR